MRMKVGNRYGTWSGSDLVSGAGVATAPGTVPEATFPYTQSQTDLKLISGSFVPERNYRIHLRRPPRRDIASQQRHSNHQQRHSYKGHWVGRAHLKQQMSQRIRYPQGPQPTNPNSDQHQLHPLANDEPEHI